MTALRHLRDSSSMADSSPPKDRGRRSLPSGTVTFLFTDIEGSTSLLNELGTEKFHEVLAVHARALRGAFADGGVEVGTEGDAFFVSFPSAPKAVAAAAAAQRALATLEFPHGATVRVRMGMHTGDATVASPDAGADYVGIDVNRATRIASAAHGGQVLLSEATRVLAEAALPAGVTLRDLGEHRLKDLGRRERLWQLCHPDIASEFPPLRSLDVVQNNLPLQLTSFIGRARELDELGEALRGSRVVTLTGVGGCGKTRLGLQAAAETVDTHADGVWWVELASVASAELVPHAVARVFGLRESEGRPLVDTLCDQLAGMDALIVLDNCEHVLDASIRLVDRLVHAAPRLRVLATSREPLGIQGELTWRVPSLDEETATRLFIERAAEVRRGFMPDAAEREVIAQICRRLDGIPLAIELAAARTRMMHPARIAAGLDDRFRLLTGGSRMVMPRQQTLETSVGWSYDLLDEEERAVLRKLAVFASGFTLDAAEQVCAAHPIDRYAVLDLLSRLVDKSLVQAEQGLSRDRYRLLETIRLYAAARLAEAGEIDATRDRHRDYFLMLAEHAEPELALADGPMWLARLEEEHDNLRAAFEWADTAGAEEKQLRLTTALTLFFEMRGHLAEGGRWFARSLARGDGSSVVRARALWGAAHVAVYGDDFATAAQRAPEALAMAEATGDDWAAARALNTLGYLQLGFEPDAGRATLGRSIELGRKIGDNWAVADGLKMLTVAWLLQQDFDALEAPLAELLRVAERLGNKFFILWYHCCVGIAATRRGELEAARRSMETSLDYCREVGEPATGGIVRAFLAEIEMLRGDYDAAEARLDAFLVRAAATGGSVGVPWALCYRATLALGRGRTSEALAIIDPFVEQMAEGLPAYRSWALAVRGAARLAAGDENAADADLRLARETATLVNDQWLVALAADGLGELARRRGDTGRAEDLHHEALAIRRTRRFRPGVAGSLEALASVAADQESYDEAVRLFGAAAALRDAVGLVRWPASQGDWEKTLARLRAALGDAAFEAAWAEGQALSIDDAVAYASRARGERKRPSTGWGSLTPTEQRIVALVAEGLTNPRVAARLFISRGTVKVHLSHIFTKLELSTRAELAAQATRRAIEVSGT